MKKAEQLEFDFVKEIGIERQPAILTWESWDKAWNEVLFKTLKEHELYGGAFIRVNFS
jgi:hypothetical protein